MRIDSRLLGLLLACGCVETPVLFRDIDPPPAASDTANLADATRPASSEALMQPSPETGESNSPDAPVASQSPNATPTRAAPCPTPATPLPPPELASSVPADG